MEKFSGTAQGYERGRVASHTLENSKDASQHIEEESEGDGETYISHKKGWGLMATPSRCHLLPVTKEVIGAPALPHSWAVGIGQVL